MSSEETPYQSQERQEAPESPLPKPSTQKRIGTLPAIYRGFLVTAIALTFYGCDNAPSTDPESLNTEETAVAYTYLSPEECTKAGYFSPEACQEAYNQTQALFAQDAPRYNSKEECERETGGEGSCVESPWERRDGQPVTSEQNQNDGDQQQANSRHFHYYGVPHRSSGDLFFFNTPHYYSPTYRGFTIMRPPPASAASAPTSMPVFSDPTGGFRTPNGVSGFRPETPCSVPRAEMTGSRAAPIKVGRFGSPTVRATVISGARAFRGGSSSSVRGGFGGFGHGMTFGG